jgi:von Hippel-Lindau disease tumor suppressor protein
VPKERSYPAEIPDRRRHNHTCCDRAQRGRLSHCGCRFVLGLRLSSRSTPGGDDDAATNRIGFRDDRVTDQPIYTRRAVQIRQRHWQQHAERRRVPGRRTKPYREFKRKHGIVPQRVDPGSAPLFDPVSGAVRARVSKRDDGCFDVYDHPGVDVHTGEPLIPVDHSLARLIIDCVGKERRPSLATTRDRAAGPLAAAIEQTRPATSKEGSAPDRQLPEALRSISNTLPVTLTFSNTTQREVAVFWKDYTGHERFYFKLEPGQLQVQQTYATHPWVVRDTATDNLILALG